MLGYDVSLNPNPRRMKHTVLLFVGIVISGFLFCCASFYALILYHDYKPMHFESDFSTAKSPKALQTTIEKDLIIGHTPYTEVKDYLELHHVQDCSYVAVRIFCSVPTHNRIFDPNHPFDIPTMLLGSVLGDGPICLHFEFKDGLLSIIRVERSTFE